MAIEKATITIELEIHDGPEDVGQALLYFSSLGKFIQDVCGGPAFRECFNITRDTVIATDSTMQPLHADLIRAAKAAHAETAGVKTGEQPPAPTTSPADAAMLKSMGIADPGTSK